MTYIYLLLKDEMALMQNYKGKTNAIIVDRLTDKESIYASGINSLTSKKQTTKFSSANF